MRLEVLGLEPGQEQRAAAEVYLTEVLADRDQRSTAFDALPGLGSSLSTGRWWMSRQRIFAWLRDNGFPPVRDPRVYADVRELRARSDRDLDADLAMAVIDAEGGPVLIDRDVEPLLAASGGTVVVVGPPGAGKTSIAARAARAERDAGRDVAYLRASDLAGTDGDIRNTLSIAHNLSEVLAGWLWPGPATLVIDGLDATRMSAPSLPLLATLASLPPRWRLVATARAFDLRHSPAWKKLFRGACVDEARSDPHLQSVRHLMVDRLTDREVTQVWVARPELAPLFDPTRPRLAELVRNPFNLNLAAGLLSGDPARVFTVRSQLDLLTLYWDQRVATGPALYGRLAVMEKLAREMIRRRRDRLHRPHDTLTTSELEGMQGLLSDGVLREAQASGYASTATPVAFAHALLFNFTVASQVLARPEDPMHLTKALAAEPDCALLLRSSLELHLAALWHGDLNPADTEAGPVPEAPTARAAEGALSLLCRNDWAASPSGARIGAAARGLLEHDQPAVRAVGVSGLHFIIPLPAARYACIAELIQDEAADFVRARLLVQLASLHLRDWLTAGNADSSRTREDAFALLTRPVAAVIRLRPAAGTGAEGHEAFSGAARVAAMVSRNLKITADAPGDIPVEFAARTFPLLEQLAEVGRPAIVHDIVRVLKRIAASDPKRTILTVATAVAAAPRYAWEPDGAQAVLDLVDTTVAEHRDRILADPQWTSALRQVLEGFVAQGIDAVIAKVHDLDVMFG